MTNLIRVRALQRRPLRIDGNVIATSGDGTVLDLDHGRTAQDVRIYQSYPFGKSRFITTGEAVAGADTGGHTVPPNKAQATLAYAKGTILWEAIELPAGETISSVTLYSGSTALNTGTHQVLGLYKLNAAGTLLTQVATSADDTSGAWTADTAKTFAFTTPYKSVGGGIYFIAFVMSGTTAPTLVGRKPANELLANFDGPSNGQYFVETLLTGANNDLRFYGTDSAVTIVYSDPGALGAESVAVVGKVITVTLANDSGPAIISTASTILATINGDTAAHALITAALKPGNTGAGVVTAMSSIALAADTLAVVAVSGDAQIALPATLATGALSKSNLEPLATLG